MDYDYLVIGGGSGGVSSARRAAEYGAKVLVVERGRKYAGAGLGGTCVNVGCVPKKLMFNAALHAEMLASAPAYGFPDAPATTKFAWEAFKTKRDAYVAKLNSIYAKNLTNSKVTVVEGVASFVSNNAVTVTNEAGAVTYTAAHILIAVGGTPAMPDLPGIEHCINSDGFFDLATQPDKVAVIGAGYIAVELAGIFHALGTDTSVYCRSNQVMRRFDPLLRDTLTAAMDTSMTLIRNSALSSITKEADGTLTIHATVEGVAVSHKGFHAVVMAIGRTPRTEDLQLTCTDIHVTASGFITVDAFENTSVDGVVAIGDVTTTGWELTPVAIAAGRRLADRLFGKVPNACLNYDQIPTVVFSHPPMGTIGYTEPDAIAKFGTERVTVYQSTFTNMFFAMTAHHPVSGMKLVCLDATETVIGLHVIGLGSDEMLQGFGVAMKMGATKTDFDACIAIHPTASEEFVTLPTWGKIKDQVVLAPHVTPKL